MRPWRFLLFVLLTCFSFEAYPAVFIVTSKADSGPGTLREALTKAAANGSAEKDYINFNLTGSTEAARTITLLSELPYVSSNVVIDGTTQPGSKIAPGDAKVIINTDPASYYVFDNTAGFTIKNVSNVAIYGLSINHFDGDIVRSSVFIVSGIIIISSKNIIIGAPGKGNMFDVDEIAVYNGVSMGFPDPRSFDIKVQSNIFGVNYPTAAYFYCDNLLFGGDGPQEGNHLIQTLSVVGNNAQIIHNYLGIDVAGNVQEAGGAQIICGNGSNLEIRDNISNFITMYLDQLDRFKITGNKDIGIINYNQSGLHITNSNDGIIGSEDITKQNVFHGDQTEAEISTAYCKNIQLFKNSIRCSTEGYDLKNPTDGVVIPAIQVKVNSATEYSGTASPGSTVYIYEDNSDCPICNPVVFYAEVIAGADGKWKITGNFKDKKMLSNALLDKNSSEFTTVRIPFSTNNGVIIQPSCGKNNGSVELNEVYNALVIEWYNLNGEKVGQGQKLDKVGAGEYYAVGRNGNCSVRSDLYVLANNDPEIYDDYLNVTMPSCGKGGSITGLAPVFNSQNPVTYTWTNKQNNVVSHEVDIADLGAGEYTFTMRDEIAGCELSYGPVILKNATGPNIDQSTANIQSTNCGQSTGSITNIGVTGTGTLKYIWWNSSQQQVGTTKDLTGQPGGTYKLQVTDDTQCGPIYTTVTIPETNGIVLDESNVTTSIASCSQNNGSIKGISFSGATKFQWMDAGNRVVSTTADFTGAAPGVYTFTASNNFGCSKTSQPYTVGQQPSVQLPQYAATTVASCFGGKSGSVTIATDALIKSLRWVDSRGAPAGDQPALTGVAPGTYKLYITDQNGCENLYNSYTVDELPKITVASTGSGSNDQCGLKTGSVNNVVITGGAPPYTYQWTDTGGKPIGDQNSISKLEAGDYVLTVTDTRCGNIIIPYTITEESAEVAAPSVSDLQLCSSGSALLIVNNASPDITYRLYESQNSAHQIDEQKGGRFNVNVSANRSYFVTQLNGTCESLRAGVKITVGLSTVNIANAFTPNSDGINDYWKIANIESYTGALVQVFTRYGERVFESKGYTKPFDGTMNGKKLPAGVYYYIISLNTKCNVLSGSLTIIR